MTDQPNLDFGECHTSSTLEINEDPWFGAGGGTVGHSLENTVVVDLRGGGSGGERHATSNDVAEHYFHLGTAGVYDQGEATQLREQLGYVTAALKWMTSERDRWRDAWKETLAAKSEEKSVITPAPAAHNPMANAMRARPESYGGVVLPDRFR